MGPIHSTHDWKQNSLRYPIPVPLLHHHTSAIITNCNRSTTLFPWLDLPGFWPGTETKREVWLLRTGFGIAPMNKLVSLTWLLWALRSFRSFTLHYIALNFCCMGMHCVITAYSLSAPYHVGLLYNNNSIKYLFQKFRISFNFILRPFQFQPINIKAISVAYIVQHALHAHRP